MSVVIPQPVGKAPIQTAWQFDEDNYTEEELKRACFLSGDVKLPVLSPEGHLVFRGLVAASAALSKSDISDEDKRKIALELVTFYDKFQRDAPEPVKKLALAHRPKRRIVEAEDNFVFAFDEMDILHRESSALEDGVKIIFDRDSKLTSSLTFSKEMFDKEKVSTWLKEFGLEPAEDEDETAVQFEDDGFRYIFLENVRPDEQSIKFNETPLRGQIVLAVEAIAITQGTWKGLHFSNDVLQKTVPLYKNARIVEHHQYSEPADVKGYIFSQEGVPGGVKIKGIVFDPDSIERVKSGKLDAVSSNFLLRADEQNNVQEVKRVVELTLTDNPACGEATITGNEVIQLTNATSTDTSISPIVVTTTNQPPPMEVQGVSMSKDDQKTPEKEEKETSTQLEEVVTLRAQLEAKENALQKMNERVAALEQDRQVRLTREVVRTHKEKGHITPANEEAAFKLYLSATQEQRELLEKFWENNPVVPVGDYSEQNSENPIDGRLTDAQLEELDNALLLDQWKQQISGEGGTFFTPALREAPASSGPVEFDDAGNAYVRSE